MDNFKKIVIFVLLLFVGAVFVFSAFAKLLSIELFEIQLVDYGFASWNTVKYTSRIILAFEASLGFLIILRISLKKVILPISIVTLVLFTLFSWLQLSSGNNTENCGCFGELVAFNFNETIIKNLILILIIVVFYFSKINTWIPQKLENISLVAIFFILLSTIVIVNPPIDIYNQSSKKAMEVGVDFPKFDEEAISKTWYNGEKMLVFVSAGCKYCKQVASKMSVRFKGEKYKEKILIVFAEIPQSSIDKFYSETNIDFQYVRIPKHEFIETTKGRFPQIFILKNGKVVSNFGKMEFFEKDVDF